jgi:putative ABC transport system ATP-binding protein
VARAGHDWASAQQALGLPWRAIDLEAGQLTVMQRLVTVAGKPTIRRGTKSPAGEQQRVAIARALAKQPALVLADEPTGNLDQDTGAQVTALLRALNAETRTTFVVVTHNPGVGSAADRTVRLAHGRVVEQAPA